MPNLARNAAGGLLTWNSDAPPVSPHPDDVYFQSGSSWSCAGGGSFVEWDPGTIAAWSVDATKRMGSGTFNTAAGLAWSGMYKAIPDTEFAFYTQVNAVSVPGGSGVAFGLMVAADIAGAAATSPFRTLDLSWVQAAPLTKLIRARSWTDYNGPAGGSTDCSDHPLYFRMRVKRTATGPDVWHCYSDFSSNGVEWTNLEDAILGFVPLYYGVAALNVDTELVTLWRFIKVFSGAGSSAFNATSIGRLA